MTKTKTIKRSLIASIVVLCILATSLIGTTFAWFTDEVTNSGNKIKAGTLKVDLEYHDRENDTWVSLKDETDPVYDYEYWEPGYTDVKLFKVVNEGTLALKWKAKLNTTATLSELATVIEVYVRASANEPTYPATRDFAAEGFTYAGTLDEFIRGVEDTTWGNLLANESAYLTLALKMKESAGNEFQGKDLGGAFDIQIVATQLSAELDSFDDQYDQGAEFDGEITNADGLAAAVQAGGNYKVLEDITLDAPIEVGAKNVTIDLAGKTITAGTADGYAFNNVGGATLIINDSAANAGVVYARRAIAGTTVNGIVYTEAGSTTIVNGGTYNTAEGGKYVFLNDGGTLIINEATINGTTSYPVYSYNAGSKLVLNNATVNGVFGCVNVYGIDSSVEINGGTYTMTGVQGKTSHIVYFSNTDATINGGTFAKVGDINMSATGGGGICAIYGAKLTINGGNFSGDYADLYNWGGTNANGRATSIEVNGGNFKFNLPTGTVPAESTSIKGDFGYFVVDKVFDEKVTDGLYKDDGVYYVANSEGLAFLNKEMAGRNTGRNTKVELLADINFEGKTWTPVDSHIDFGNFTLSEFNGNGYTIYNLTVNGQAMFTRFSNGANAGVTFKDITFDGATVNSNTINTAIIVAHTYNDLVLDNVDVYNSSVSGGYKVAPLIATVYNEGPSTITATLKNCDVENVTVTATSYDFCTTGMVAFVYEGDNDKVEFENCTVTDVYAFAPNAYTAHAAVYTTGSETLFNEVEGVTVTNFVFENK